MLQMSSAAIEAHVNPRINAGVEQCSVIFHVCDRLAVVLQIVAARNHFLLSRYFRHCSAFKQHSKSAYSGHRHGHALVRKKQDAFWAARQILYLWHGLSMVDFNGKWDANRSGRFCVSGSKAKNSVEQKA